MSTVGILVDRTSQAGPAVRDLWRGSSSAASGACLDQTQPPRW